MSKETYTKADTNPCNDCRTPTIPRDKNGYPLEGQCESFLVTTKMWNKVAGKARFLCVGCFEARLGRKLFWKDFLVKPGRDFFLLPGIYPSDMCSRLTWTKVSPFDSPRLALCKVVKDKQLRQRSVRIMTPTKEDYMWRQRRPSSMVWTFKGLDGSETKMRLKRIG